MALERLTWERRELTQGEQERIVELADLEERRAKMHEHLGQLPAGLREAIELRVIGERSYHHVAEALDISEQAARARVSRGLRALAQALHDDEDFEDRPTHG